MPVGAPAHHSRSATTVLAGSRSGGGTTDLPTPPAPRSWSQRSSVAWPRRVAMRSPLTAAITVRATSSGSVAALRCLHSTTLHVPPNLSSISCGTCWMVFASIAIGSSLPPGPHSNPCTTARSSPSRRSRITTVSPTSTSSHDWHHAPPCFLFFPEPPGGGNRRLTSSELHLHRTSVYWPRHGTYRWSLHRLSPCRHPGLTPTVCPSHPSKLHSSGSISSSSDSMPALSPPGAPCARPAFPRPIYAAMVGPACAFPAASHRPRTMLVRRTIPAAAFSVTPCAVSFFIASWFSMRFRV